MNQTKQKQKAQRFQSLHQRGNPLVLFNCWDAGSAKIIADSGAHAIASGSWSVAAAMGYADGEKLPLALVLDNIQRIVAAVDLPVTLDFESGYAADEATLRDHIGLVLQCGVVGINFEDQNQRSGTLYSIEQQCQRIAAIRTAADDVGVPLFINARTDLFLNAEIAAHSTEHVEEAITRARAYADAGANGFFAPWLCDAAFIRQLCQTSPLPVNIMMMPQISGIATLAELGVARVSYGPAPYRLVMAALQQAARAAQGWQAVR